MKTNNLILDFSHVYRDENLPEDNKVHWIDCSDIEESDLYCSETAAKEIWSRIKSYGISGIHFVDSGNYHYMTKIMTDHIKEPFSLILFDHHTDMQKPLIENVISCGDWAGAVLKENEYLQQLVMIGPQENDIRQIDLPANRLITFSLEELKSGAGKEKLEMMKKTVPLYLSVDKDILDERYSETNWNQGQMSLSMLEHLLKEFLNMGKILGIDICGECQMGIPLPEYLEAEATNARTNEELFRFLMRNMS